MFKLYCYLNKIVHDVYVGQTVENTLEKRAGHNFSNYKGSVRFYNALQKYGSENFEVWIFEIVDTKEQADQSEIFWIAEMRRILGQEHVYNITDGGGGVMLDRPVTLETRAKISQFNKNKKGKAIQFNDGALQTMSIKSKNNKGLLSNDQKQNILDLFDTGKYTKKHLASIFNVEYETIRFVIRYHKQNGFKTPEEIILNRSNAHKGKILSEEHKQKVSQSLKGIIFTEERKKNISNALKGKEIPQSVRDKIAITLSGDPNYIETKNKIINLFITGNYTRKELSIMFDMKYANVKQIIRKFRKQNQ